MTKWDAHPVDIARCDSPNMCLDAHKTAPDTQIWTDLVAQKLWVTNYSAWVLHRQLRQSDTLQLAKEKLCLFCKSHP